MAVFYIREFADVGKGFMGNVIQSALEPNSSVNSSTDRTLTISGATLTSLTFGTRLLMLHADAICSYKFGTASTVVASTTNMRMAANETRYVSIDQQTVWISVIVNT